MNGPERNAPELEDPELKEPERDAEHRAAERAREAAERRRRRARVFGDVLPEATRDESGRAWGDADPGGDEWLRRQVPPHHG